MTIDRARGRWIHCMALVFGALSLASAQCPGLPTSSASGTSIILCEGSSATFSTTGIDLPVGSNVDWYIFTDGTQNPYNGEGTIIGTVPVSGDPCSNQPEVLYIMVNPDNSQVGSSGDQCDEFMVLWTGSGGFSTTDIAVTNLGPGSFSWNSFIAGNASTFSCGSALPPGPVPENAILIIQSSPNNNVPINIDDLCASGLPVYIIAYDGTGSCTGGYFDNNSPCSSCPVMIEISGNPCQIDLNIDYQPPSSSVDGWAWANTGSGVYADVVPPLNIPVYNPPTIIVDDFVWTVPPDFCETMGGGDYWVAGIPDPPPGPGCPQIITEYFGLTVSCPSLILAGGGDVCEGNCPDAPTEISFQLIGDDVPFTADIIIMASAFPPFPINDLQIDNGYHIQVCLSGLFPSFDPASGILNVPIFAVGITATVTIVSLTSNAGCPVTVNPNSITLNFIAAPTTNAGSNQVICEGELVDLSGSLGGSATEGEWSTSGDGDFDDPSDLNAQYTPGPNDISNGSVTLTLTGTDANGSCIPGESTLTVTIQPSIDVATNTPITICNTDVANIIAMVTGGVASFTWETSGDGDFDDPQSATTIYAPGPSDINGGTVTLTYVPDNANTCIINNQPLVITLVAAPQVTTPQNVEVCVGDSAVFSINVSGSYSTITWSTNGDGSLMVINDVEVTYDPGPQDIAGQFVIVSVTVQSTFPQCGSTTYNIPININDCNCPDLETNPPASPLCADAGVLDLNDLLVVGDPGSWAIITTPQGTNPAFLSGSVFTVNNADPGTYVVSYTVTSPQPGCPSSSMETIIVRAPVVPEAGPDQTFCGPATIILDGIYTPSSNLTTLWETNGDGFFNNPLSLSTNYNPGHLDSLALGVVLSLQVTDVVCGEQVDSINAYFNAQPFATFTNDTVIICNETQYGSVLNFNLLVTGGDLSGTWMNVSSAPVDFSNPAAVDFNGIAVGYYEFQYRTNTAISPCTDTTYSIYIDVQNCSCPLLTLNNPPAGICNNLLTLPLDAFIMSGAPGTWQILSTPPGSNPATLSGSVLTVKGVDQGDYRFRFTLNGAPLDGCVDSAEFSIFIQDIPALDLGVDTVMCNDQVLNLFPALSGSAISVDWSASGDMGMFSADPAPNTSYTFSTTEVSGHNVIIYGTTIDTFGFCPQQKDTLKVHVVIKSFIVWSQLFTTVCNNADSGSVVNFTPFIMDGDINPDWLDVDNSGANRIGGNRFDFDGVTPGTYTFRATTNNSAPPCGQESYDFEITVRDCSCPALALSPDDVILCEGITFDLSAQIIDAAPGSWAVTNGPPSGAYPIISGSILNTANTSAGVYTVTYTLTDSMPGCPASASILVTVEKVPSFKVQGKPCDVSHNFYNIIFTSDADQIQPDFGKLKAISAGKYSIDSIPEGQNVQVGLTSVLGACTTTVTVAAPNCNCTLMTEDLVDTLTLCPGDSFKLIPFVTGAAGFPTYYWIDIATQDTVKWFSFEVSKPGTYVWVVIDTLMCEARDTFTAEFIGPTAVQFTSVSPTCPNETNGEIIILDVIDGLPPYSIQLDNGAPTAISVFPYTITQVGLGQHVLSIIDLTGCTFEQPVTVSNNSFGTIDLGPDVTITKGDSTQIIPVVTNIGVSAVQWNLPFLPADLMPFWFGPDTTTLIQVMVTDTSGCLYTDDITITVIEKAVFFIPNIFSPNDDQINDQIIVSTNIPDNQLISFEIFDRWGNMLFRQVDNPPMTWDGKSNGKFLNPGVYVYKLIYQDANGKHNVMVGDITLIR
jgi:gliding motility-associated-like protein